MDNSRYSAEPRDKIKAFHLSPKIWAANMGEKIDTATQHNPNY